MSTSQAIEISTARKAGSRSSGNKQSRARMAEMFEHFAALLRRPDIKKIEIDLEKMDLILSEVRNKLTASGMHLLEDKSADKIRSIVNGNLRRQHAIYEELLSWKLLKLPEYRRFMERLIPAAVESHVKGMKYFGLVIGDDVMGPGKGMIGHHALAALRGIVHVTCGTVKRPEQLNWEFESDKEKQPVSVSKSYGFWAYDSDEPDKALIGKSHEWITSQEIPTENHIEHMLHVSAHIYRKGLPNKKISTLVSTPLANKRIANFGVQGDKVKIFFSLPGAADSQYSHRRVVRVFPKKVGS